MPNNNKKLHRAKANPKDEFYTRIEDIEQELQHYKKHFKGKTVFCNCDDPEFSNFYKYFYLKFDEFGLEKLITTHYEREKPSYKLIIYKSTGIIKQEKIPLHQNGDFRSPEAIEALEEADLACTNPPFSLFREYVGQLNKYNKKFLIIGNRNAVTYKEVFPLIKDNKIWLGCTPKIKIFKVPDNYDGRDVYIGEDGIRYVKNVGLACWFTNLDIPKQHEKLELLETYSSEKYPKYDNYNAVNVDKVKDIPKDYDGIIGVPVTFLDKYNPEQFEIIGCSYSYGEPVGYHYKGKNFDVSILGQNKYKRLFIKSRNMQ